MPPAAAPTTVDAYAKLLVRSRLLHANEVKSALRRWQEAGKATPDDVEGFRRFLVASRQLTEYQAALVNRGHAEGFFLDQYKILDKIGKGRMAGVYRAAHPSGQVVAIKVLPPSKAREPGLLARFQREARMLTRLDHPNVVRAFQVGEAGGNHYFVMEHIEGETLDEVIERRKRIPPLEAVRIAYQTLTGLQHIHEKGLIHRDIKPANLMLTPAPASGQPDTTLGATVKILDIGLGRTVFDEATREPDPDTPITGEGVLLGTPDYLAPEQARNARDADIRADIYSVGCVLYHMLTGQPPFPDKSVMGQMVRHATEQARPLSDFRQPVPDGLQPVLNWLMAKDPSQRYPTPERAAMALQIFLTNVPGAGAAPAAAPVNPAYLQYLQAGDVEPAKAPPAAAVPDWVAENIPVGRLEPAARKAEKPRDKPPEPPRAKEPPKPAPAAPAQPASAPFQPAEFDVELVSVPEPARAEDGDRGLLDLNRRDWLMLGMGGGGVLFAILAGYGIAQLVRRRPPEPTPPAEENNQEPPKPE